MSMAKALERLTESERRLTLTDQIIEEQSREIQRLHVNYGLKIERLQDTVGYLRENQQINTEQIQSLKSMNSNNIYCFT